MIEDGRGLAVSTSSRDAVAALDRAILGYAGARLDTGDHLKAALAGDPDMPLAHCVKGLFLLLFARRDFLERAKTALAAAERAASVRETTARERRYLDLLKARCAGQFRQAAAILDRMVAEYPLDLMALKQAENAHFYHGENAAMRRSVASALPAWRDTMPGYGFVLGMKAFACEEMGDYGEAEAAGREAVARNPEDVWAAHAVAHVMEMQGRPREGIAWIDGLAAHWKGCNNFAYHVWWHRALYWFELERHDRVLALYDEEVRPQSTEDYLDICNAVALLWRLERAGVDVGRRWTELAERSAARSGEHMLVFADLHFAIALAAADLGSAERLLASARRYADDAEETQAEVMREAGLAVIEAALADRRGAHDEAVDRLLAARPALHRIGGSHAQRDLFELMLVDNAMRAGRLDLARDLLTARTHEKPRSPATWRGYARALAALGEANAAAEAERRAALLVAA